MKIERHLALSAIPEMDLDVIPPPKKRDKDVKPRKRLKSKTPKNIRI